jgi:hypothetical protein
MFPYWKIKAKFAAYSKSAEMKKTFFSFIIIITLIVAGFSSCKKNYHCSCSYNNEVVYSTYIGSEVKDKATTKCSSYDTTVPGQAWNCKIY